MKKEDEDEQGSASGGSSRGLPSRAPRNSRELEEWKKERARQAEGRPAKDDEDEDVDPKAQQKDEEPEVAPEGMDDEEDGVDSGTKRKALWDLIDPPPSKEAK